MSYLGHRCTKCGHPDMWRFAQRSKFRGTAARCPKRSCACMCDPAPEPEVIPTWGLNGQPVERIIKPGENLTLGHPTCGCDTCKALYADLTGQAA